MPAGAAWLGPLEWPELEAARVCLRSREGLGRRLHRRCATWLTLQGWRRGPQDLFDPSPKLVTQPELWEGGIETTKMPRPPGLVVRGVVVYTLFLVKRLTLSVDRVRHTAEDFCLGQAVLVPVQAMRWFLWTTTGVYSTSPLLPLRGWVK